MNSQRDNACKSLANVSYGDIIIAPAARFDEFHGLHKHFSPWIHSKNLKGVCI